jgi:hypothetical protein
MIANNNIKIYNKIFLRLIKINIFKLFFIFINKFLL